MRRKPRKGGGFQFETEVEEIGGLGDGISHLEDGRLVYLPHTVPGDRVLARTKGEKAGAIHKEGKKAVRESLPELVALSKQLSGYKQRAHALPEVEDAFSLLRSDGSRNSRDN